MALQPHLFKQPLILFVSLLMSFSVSSLASSCKNLLLPVSAVDGIYTLKSAGSASADLIRMIRNHEKKLRKFASTIAGRELSKPARLPVGKLILTEHSRSRGSQNGRFYKDEAGELYYLKPDLLHQELQTGAEAISAAIYRHFDIFAPETMIVAVEGVRYSASRLLPDGRDSTLVSEMPNTSQNRMMRIVAGFLQDWDRLRVGPNNRIFADGSIGVYDLGGTLGARAQGDFKPGAVFSEAIGSFTASEVGSSDQAMAKLFDTYEVDWLPANHPWRNLTPADVAAAREYFRTLDTNKIEEIVERAAFRSTRDSRAMSDSLRKRRNTFFELLEEHFNANAPVVRDSYWAKFIPESPLVFDVQNDRSPQIGADIQAFVKGVSVAPGHTLLFRGQAMDTHSVSSAMARSGEFSSVPEVEQAFDEHLRQMKKELNEQRDEAADYAAVSSDTDEHSWWDRANPLDALCASHSRSNGDSFLVSATRSLGVASRWIEGGRLPTTYRYVYILSVPTEKTVPITRSLLTKHGSIRENEVAVLYDATPYVIAVYDTIELKFVDAR